MTHPEAVREALKGLKSIIRRNCSKVHVPSGYMVPSPDKDTAFEYLATIESALLPSGDEGCESAPSPQVMEAIAAHNGRVKREGWVRMSDNLLIRYRDDMSGEFTEMEKSLVQWLYSERMYAKSVEDALDTLIELSRHEGFTILSNREADR